MFLGTNAVLSGFTLTNGSARNGGGLYCESAAAVISNCVLSGDHADRYGGGAYVGTLNNCIVYFNTAPQGANYLTGTNQWGQEVTNH